MAFSERVPTTNAISDTGGSGAMNIEIAVPRGTRDGEMLVIFMVAGDYITAYTHPAVGWTEAQATNLGAQGSVVVYWRIASNEPASYQIPTASGGTIQMRCVVGGPTTSPVGISGVAVDGTSTAATINTPAQTAPHVASYTVGFYHAWNSSPLSVSSLDAAWTDDGRIVQTMVGGSRFEGLDALVHRQESAAAVGGRAGTYNANSYLAAASLTVAVPLQSGPPSSTVSAGTWTTNSGGTTDLHLTVDETPASDADYVRSVAAPSAAALRLRGSGLTRPTANTDWRIDFRHALDAAQAGGAMSLTLEAQYNGAALSPAASTTVTPASAAWVAASLALTTTQAAQIVNPSLLDYLLTATQAVSTPALVGWGTAAWTATNGQTFTPTIVNGSVGDMLVAIVQRNDTAAPTTPSGWTNVAALTGTNGTQSVGVFYKVATSATGATDQTAFTFASTGTVARGGVVGRFSGVLASGSPFDQTSKLNVASTATTVNSTNVTSTVADTLAVFVACNIGLRSTTNATTNWPAGSGVTAFASQNTNVGNDMTIGYASKFFAASSSSYLTPGIVWTTNTTTGVGMGLLFGLKPPTNNNRAQVSYARLFTPQVSFGPLPVFQRRWAFWRAA